MKKKEFLSAGEAARALGVSVKTIQRWDKAGLLPVVRTATNQRRIPIDAIHRVLNAPGTIDADYRGEIQVILVNLGPAPFTVERGMRIAQLVISAAIRAEICEVAKLDETTRGVAGFGSTGLAPGRNGSDT